VDSQFTVLSGLTLVRQTAANSTAFVDVSVINPTSKYLGNNFIN
jgi:hypothetical protein